MGMITPGKLGGGTQFSDKPKAGFILYVLFDLGTFFSTGIDGIGPNARSTCLLIFQLWE